MENEQNELRILDEKYQILKTINQGGFGKVYKVKDLKTGVIYAAKVPLINNPKYEDALDNEYNILDQAQNPFTVNLITKGEGYKSKNGIQSKQKVKYFIMKFIEKGDLSQYVDKIKQTFEEKHAKVIFKKILEGVLECHKKGICHRDLKLENILLDGLFNPIIADFGLATLIQGSDGSGKLKEKCGTEGHIAPEIIQGYAYEGIKADIFSLGIILCYLVTLKTIYRPKMNERKKFVFNTEYGFLIDGYFKTFYKLFPETLSKEFKDLLIKMISYKPSNRISSITEILDDPWFKEIRELNDEEFQNLENEIRTNFLERETKIRIPETYKYIPETENEETARSAYDEYFTSSLSVKDLKDGINMNDFIRIEGRINPCKFMNDLASSINNKYKNKCDIDNGYKTYKFVVDFESNQEENQEELLKKLEELNIDEENKENKENKGEDQEDDEEVNEEMEKANNLHVEIKLFKSENDIYVVRFKKKGGEMHDYYKKLSEIKAIIKEEII